jgi:hypothetical protein
VSWPPGVGPRSCAFYPDRVELPCVREPRRGSRLAPATSLDVFRDDHSAGLVACDDLCEGGGGLVQAAGTRGRHV